MEVSSFALVMTIVNLGYAEAVLDVINAAAHERGVIIHARRARFDKHNSFMGIDVGAEKEIVSVIVPTDKKTDLMKRISTACGITTPAHGVLFALPVYNHES